MKRVILLRHAKSDWSADYADDHERPLNPRGRKAAALMGLYLARTGQLPDAVISSTAVRARDTVALAAAAGEWTCPVALTDEFYEASPDAVLELIRANDDATGSVLLAGHEPTWSLLLGLLVGGAHVRFPTAAMARVDLAADSWSEVTPGGGILSWMVTPKLLGKIGWPS